MFRNKRSIVFEDDKHDKDQAARKVDERSLISLNFRHDVSDVSRKGNLVRLRIIDMRRVVPQQRISQFYN